MDKVFLYAGLILCLIMVLSLYRAVLGPSVLDRLIGVNAVGSKTTVLLVLVGLLFHRVDMFVDIALALCLAQLRGRAGRVALFPETGRPGPLKGSCRRLMNLAVTIILGVGLVFFLGGAVGILRFPDFYSRLHPAGKMDTLGSFLMLGALALYHLYPFTLDNVLVAIKIMLIVVFYFMASPTATHAIVDAGIRAGQGAWQKPGRGAGS